MISEFFMLSESGEDLLEAIKIVLEKIKLKVQKLLTFTSDNASNNVTLGELLNKLAKTMRLPCLFHILHLMESKSAFELLRCESDNVKEYEKLKFFKQLSKISNFVEKEWDKVKFLLVLAQKGEIEKFIDNDEKNRSNTLKDVSAQFIAKPIFGEFHRFHSFSPYSDFIVKNCDNFKKIFEYLSKINYKGKLLDNQKEAKFEKFVEFFENKTEIFAMKDIFGIFDKMINLCYRCKGFCIEDLFVKLKKFQNTIENGLKLSDSEILQKFTPNLKSNLSNENEKKWAEKLRKSLTGMQEILQKWYKPVQESTFWQWAMLGNKKTCLEIKKLKLQQKDEFENWINEFSDWFNNDDSDIANEPKLLEKWCNIFGSINITEISAESAVKHLKLYTNPHENVSTIDSTITHNFNKTEIPVNSKTINFFKKEYKNELEEEKKKREEKKDKEFIDKKTELIFDSFLKIICKKSNKKVVDEPKNPEEEICFKIIDNWKTSDKKFRWTSTKTLSKTNLNRILNFALGFMPPKEWTQEERIQLLSLLHCVQPKWLEPNILLEKEKRKIFRSSPLIQWMKGTGIQTIFDCPKDRLPILTKELERISEFQKLNSQIVVGGEIFTRLERESIVKPK